MRCPECGGTEVVSGGDGYATCMSSRRHSPRGPDDLAGRVCGTRFRVELTDEDRRRAAEWTATGDRWRAWMRTTGRQLAEATEARDIAVLVDALAREFSRIRSTFPMEDVAQDVYLAAWRRFIVASELPHTHDLVEVRFEKRLFGSTCEDRSRRALWSGGARDASGVYGCIDAEGAIVEVHPAGLVTADRKAGTASLVVGAGQPCKVVGRTERSHHGATCVWRLDDAGGTPRPLPDDLRDSAFPFHIAGIMGTYLQGAAGPR